MRTYKFRLYPTKDIENKLYDNLNISRKLYNFLLETWFKYDEQGISLSAFDMSKYITSLKKQSKWSQLNNHNAKMIQMVTQKLGKSIKSFKQLRKKGFRAGNPRFKSQSRYSSFIYNQSGFKIISINKRYNLLNLSKIGDIHLRQHRDIKGNIKQIQVKKSALGWYAYITTDNKYECKNIKSNEIGIDLGINHFYTDSNNHTVANPLHLREKLSRLKILQQKLSKTIRGSNNRRKLIIKIQRLFEQIDNKKKDFFHKVSTNLVKNNSYIVMEDLNIKSMTDKSKGNKYHNKRNILDSSWGMFTNMLKMKVESTTSELISVNPANTTKMCSNCGKLKEMRLSDRIYICVCGLELDRDYNSAINILRIGKGLTFVGEDTLVSSMNREALSFRVV